MQRTGLVFFLVLYSIPAWAQTVYLKSEEALKVIFEDSESIVLEKKHLSPQPQRDLEKKLGSKIEKTDWNFYVAKTGNHVDGYAAIDNEVGKTEPITFLTAITPGGEVKAVEILVYREPIGSEVHEKRFLKQYQGKTVKDPIHTGQDIQNISGATLSARAVSIGVHRVLHVWEIFYGRP